MIHLPAKLRVGSRTLTNGRCFAAPKLLNASKNVNPSALQGSYFRVKVFIPAIFRPTSQLAATIPFPLRTSDCDSKLEVSQDSPR